MLKTELNIREYLEAEHARVMVEIDDLSRIGRRVAHFDQERNLMRRTTLEHRLLQIEKALLSLETGTYGVCEACGISIDPERMQALPYATTCVPCKTAQENTKKNGKGPADRSRRLSVWASEVSSGGDADDIPER